MIEILILFYSRSGHTKDLAREIQKGVLSVKNCEAKLRTVPSINSSEENAEQSESLTPFVTKTDLKSCNGIALGTPTRFGTMAAPMKVFFEQTSDIWLSGSLIDKPAVVFTSTSSLHGGQEATLLSMAVPLLHHGMIILGIPYSNNVLMDTTTGGTPYGASHLAGSDNANPLSEDEKITANSLGRRLANAALKLKTII